MTVEATTFPPPITGDLTKALKVGDLCTVDDRIGIFRVICTDAPGLRPLVFLRIGSLYPNEGYLLEQCTADGTFSFHSGPETFRRHCPYADFKVDEPVLCRDTPEEPWKRRHFAGISRSSNLPLAYLLGRTSFTSDGSVSPWNYMRRPLPSDFLNDSEASEAS